PLLYLLDELAPHHTDPRRRQCLGLLARGFRVRPDSRARVGHPFWDRARNNAAAAGGHPGAPVHPVPIAGHDGHPLPDHPALRVRHAVLHLPLPTVLHATPRFPHRRGRGGRSWLVPDLAVDLPSTVTADTGRRRSAAVHDLMEQLPHGPTRWPGSTPRT